MSESNGPDLNLEEELIITRGLVLEIITTLVNLPMAQVFGTVEALNNLPSKSEGSRIITGE